MKRKTRTNILVVFGLDLFQRNAHTSLASRGLFQIRESDWFCHHGLRIMSRQICANCKTDEMGTMTFDVHVHMSPTFMRYI